MVKDWIRWGLLGVCLSCAPAWGQMAESLKSEYHKQDELGAVMINPGESELLKAALADPKTRIVALQLFEQDFRPEMLEPLLAWVRAGHSLWFYDPRLGPYFGFEPAIMKRDPGHKRETGGLGGRKREGVATTALAMGSHVVNTGVGQVSAFLPKLNEKDEYGGVNVTADTVSLLRFRLDSPAIAALRREGRGLIVFKPLMWTEALSGDRFQSNLLEFSAGYQIPGPAGAGKIGNPPGPEAEFIQGKPAHPLVETVAAPVAPPTPNPDPDQPPATPAVAGTAPTDEVEISGEGKLVGTVSNQKLRFETGTSSVELTRAEVESLVLAAGPGQLDVVHWRDGRQSKGWLLEKNIEFEVQGDTRKLEKRVLRVIRWGKGSPEPR